MQLICSVIPTTTTSVKNRDLKWVGAAAAGMADEMTIRIVGLIASLLGIVAWAPQIKKVWVEKRHDGISLPTFWVIVAALAMWLIYGIMINAFEVILGNVLALTMVLGVIVGVMRARNSGDSDIISE